MSALLPQKAEIMHTRLKRAGEIERIIITHSLPIVNDIIILITVESYLYGFGPLLSIKTGSESYGLWFNGFKQYRTCFFIVVRCVTDVCEGDTTSVFSF